MTRAITCTNSSTEANVKRKQAKKYREAIRLTWSSLDSHINYAHKGKLGKGESRKFHKKCTIEYAKVILALCRKM